MKKYKMLESYGDIEESEQNLRDVDVPHNELLKYDEALKEN